MVLVFGFLALSWFSAAFVLLPAVYFSWRSLRKAEITVSDEPPDYAGFWVRLGSLIVDAGIYSLFLILMHLFFHEDASMPLVSSGFQLGKMAVILYMVKRWGQSPGKMVFGIKIVKTDLTALGWKEVFLRDWNGIFTSIRYFAEYLLIFLGILLQDWFLPGRKTPLVSQAES